MLDFLRISIPFKQRYTHRLEVDDSWVLLGHPSDYGFQMASRSVRKDERGHITASELYHPYESLPSSFSSMACKLYHNCPNYQPCVEIKASPAKLMQGHNVYGSESIENGALYMIGLLLESITTHNLGHFLDLKNAEIRDLDCTYSSNISDPAVVPKLIDYLASISNGQTKATADKKFKTTAYWGGQNSRLIQLKTYHKGSEVKNEVEKLLKRSKKGDLHSAKMLNEVYTPDLINTADHLMRWEARIKHRKLERLGIPTNLIQLIKYERENKNFLRTLWQNAFDPIFKAMTGELMPYVNDDVILNMLKRKLVTYGKKTGKPSYTRALNAMGMYHLIRDIGLKSVKERYSNPSFYRNLGYLLEAGFKKADLQNLNKEGRGKVIPIVKFTNVCFDTQTPANWVEPVNKYAMDWAA